MLILTFKKFNESSMFSFFRRNSMPKNPTLIGRIVAIDSSAKSSDGYRLTHVYVVKDDDGAVGQFLGNLRKSEKGKNLHFRKCHSKLVEKINGWRDLSEIELKAYKIGSF